MERRRAGWKKRRQELKKQLRERKKPEVRDSSPDDQFSATASILDEEEDEQNSDGLESSPHMLSSLGNSEGEIAYEESFDARVVRLGKAFVLHGCPWIKGGEWDAVEATWDVPNDPDELDPTSLLKRYLKEEGIVFQAWRQEGFESAVRLASHIG